MMEYADLVFFITKLFIVWGVVMIVWMAGLVLHERYVEGNADAFKPERRVGPADRRAEAHGL